MSLFNPIPNPVRRVNYGHLKVMDAFDSGKMRMIKTKWANQQLTEHERDQYADRNWVAVFRKPNVMAGFQDASGGANTVVSEAIIGALMTALVCNAQHSVVDLTSDQTVNVPVTQFKSMTTLEQYGIINKIWAAMTQSIIPQTDSETMAEPTPAESGNEGKAYHSALIPNGGGTYTKHPDAPDSSFAKFAIGFRTEGLETNNQDLTRILTQGFSPLYQNPQLTAQLRGQQVANTIMADRNSVKLFLDNMDVVGETGICASRTLFGAAAFPTRESVGKYWLWAIRLKGHKGYDTEAFQKERLWRPGEKVYTSIPPERLLARVLITKTGTATSLVKKRVVSDGWQFEIAAGAQWTYIENRATPLEKAYLSQLLSKWQGKHSIPGTMDFAS